MTDYVNTDNLKKLGLDVLKTSAGIMAVNMSGLSQMVRDRVGTQNRYLSYGADGLIYAAVREGVDYLSGEQTVLNGDLNGYIDNIAFMSLWTATASESGLIGFGYNQISNLSPLDAKMNLALTEGVVISSGTVVSDMLDKSPMVPEQLKLVRHVTRLWA